MSDAPTLRKTGDLHEHDLRRKVKRELRKRMRALRSTIPADACADRSARIVVRVLALEGLRTARSVALFWPIEDRHEVDLRPLDAELRARGVRIAYPAIVPSEDDSTPSVMVFRFVDDVAALAEQGYGFAEPPVDAVTVSPDLHELDVIVVPALALDPTGQRIGYGAGYYDRAIATAAALKVGVIFDFQLVSEVPMTDGDVPVDWVVSDTRTLRVAAE